MSKTLSPDFEKLSGLLPVVIQDVDSGDVLMQAFMNQEAWRLTRQTKFVHFWSRSRQCLWQKGEHSGNRFQVKSITLDCDGDSVLIKVKVCGDGRACHTGRKSCFFRNVWRSR